jgi:sulfate adenylyltransferase subunit 2
MLPGAVRVLFDNRQHCESIMFLGPASHLRNLESESIHIIREVAAECRSVVLLYSIGKDSSVLLHLALKAFYPAKLPFPVLHIDTGWKFREMIEFRDKTAARLGIDLLVHTHQEGKRLGVNPFDHGATYYTRVMKTEALKRALRDHGFDAALGGARRDEEKSRAKERVVSVRTSTQEWDPAKQRAEFWRLYNCRLHAGESIRAFPLANWTELDVWRYIELERIPVVSLYFAKPRPVVEREGLLIVVDDERMPLAPDERPRARCVRFRSLGCYPLTAAVESSARTVAEIVAETERIRISERGGRLIDGDAEDSLEFKKREGYF